METLIDEPDYQMVRFRNVYEPICIRLMELSQKVVKNYFGDLCVDTLTLANANVGDKFLWACRVSGTELYNLNLDWAPNLYPEILEASGAKMENVYLLEVTAKRDLYADGYVTWINAKDWDTIKRVVIDNRTK